MKKDITLNAPCSREAVEEALDQLMAEGGDLTLTNLEGEVIDRTSDSMLKFHVSEIKLFVRKKRKRLAIS